MSRDSKPFLIFTFVFLLALAFTPRVSAQNANCAQTYIVAQGDWLSTVAQKFLGDVKAYPAIQQATNDAAKTDSSFALINDPNKIEVGQKLCIPEKANTPLPPQGPGPVIPSAAGSYTHVGPAADASALVETIMLTQDFQATYILDYIGKARITQTGTWTTENFQYVVTLTNQNGKPINEQMKFQLDAQGNLVSVGTLPLTYAKTAPEVVRAAGLYTANRASADGQEKLIALALLPNGIAQLTASSQANPFILQTGTWQIGTNADTNAASITVALDKQGDTAIHETYAFQIDGDNLRGTQYDANKWGTDLTFTKFNAPSEPETPASAGG